MRIRILTGIVAGLLCGAFGALAAPIVLRADRVVVLKKERTLQLLNHGKIVKSYRVALGGDPIGPKKQQGDHKTPEGVYILDSRNAHSSYYKSIHISYPNARDRAAALKSHVSAGGDVFIHGLPNGYKWVGKEHLLKDWTDGCVAVTDEEMDEIWRAVQDGTPIEIRP
jgi:murein L,D-transpeptidase YafK